MQKQSLEVRFMVVFPRDVSDAMIAHGQLKLCIATRMTTPHVNPTVPFGSCRVDVTLVDVVARVVTVARCKHQKDGANFGGAKLRHREKVGVPLPACKWDKDDFD